MNDLTFVLLLSAFHIVGLIVLAALLAVAFGGGARSGPDEERRDQGDDPPHRPPEPPTGRPPLPTSGHEHARLRRGHLPVPARRATHPSRRPSKVR